MNKPKPHLDREALVELDVVELESMDGGQSGWLCITWSAACVTKTFGCVTLMTCV